MTRDEVIAFDEHPWSADAVALRRWDDEAKDPEGPVLAIDDLLGAHARVMKWRMPLT
jgi:gamma-butyrobetaine dioxygenase